MTVREAFEAIYGPRNGSSMSVAQWDVRSQVWDKAHKAGRESMREEAAAEVIRTKMYPGGRQESWAHDGLNAASRAIKELP